jgi:hypothetical protein
VAHERPKVSDGVPSTEPAARRDPKRGDRTRVTRAEARARRRSAPLTPQQFRELSRLAEQGISPLRYI